MKVKLLTVALVAMSGHSEDCGFDIMHVQDLTYSKYAGYLAEEVPKGVRAIKDIYPETRLGVASHRDKPIQVLGSEEGPPYQPDYCYNLYAEITGDIEFVADKIKWWTSSGGGDEPENQLEAMMHATWTTWNTNDAYDDNNNTRVVMLVTDARYHKEGDFAENNYFREYFEILPAPLPFTKNDGDAVLNCTNEDYPSIEQLRAALVTQNAIPFFLVTERAVQNYRDLLVELNIPGVVRLLEDDYSNYHEQVLAAFNLVASLKGCAVTTRGPTTVSAPDCIQRSTLPQCEPGCNPEEAEFYCDEIEHMSN